MIDSQTQLFPSTASNVDAIWTTWQQLTEVERGQFLDRVRHACLTRVQTTIIEFETTKKPPHHRRHKRMEAYR